MNYLEASMIFLQSYGIAWFSLDLLRCVIKPLVEKGKLTRDALGALIERYAPRFRRASEAYYIERLLWHLGLISIRGDGEYVPTNTCHILYASMRDDESFRRSLIRVLCKWRPFVALVRYIGRKKVRVRDIIRDLGGEMKEYSMKMKRYGLLKALGGRRRVPFAKPYNSFVVRNFFVPLLRELGLVDIDGSSIYLSFEGLELLEGIDVARTLVLRNAPFAPTALVAYQQTLLDSKDEFILISPWVNSMLEYVMKPMDDVKKLENIIIVLRNERDIDHVKRCASMYDVEVRAYVVDRLHAKLSCSSMGSAFLGSANITKGSLLKNYEVGVFYMSCPEELFALAYDMISQARRYFLIKHTS